MRRSSYEGLAEAQAGCKEGVKEEPNSPWGGASDRENSHSLGRDSPLGSNTRDIYSSEQLVPGHGTYQPYRYLLIIYLWSHCCKCICDGWLNEHKRISCLELYYLDFNQRVSGKIFTKCFSGSFLRFPDYNKSTSPTSSSMSSSAGRSSFESRVPDIATVPEQDSKVTDLVVPQCPPPATAGVQDYAGVLNVAVAQAKPGMLGHHALYAPYSTDQTLSQWSGTSSAQYPSHPHHHHHLAADYGTQAVHHGYHHANMADWSQYPLFSYSCWWSEKHHKVSRLEACSASLAPKWKSEKRTRSLQRDRD